MQSGPQPIKVDETQTPDIPPAPPLASEKEKETPKIVKQATEVDLIEAKDVANVKQVVNAAKARVQADSTYGAYLKSFVFNPPKEQRMNNLAEVAVAAIQLKVDFDVKAEQARIAAIEAEENTKAKAAAEAKAKGEAEQAKVKAELPQDKTQQSSSYLSRFGNYLWNTNQPKVTVPTSPPGVDLVGEPQSPTPKSPGKR